MNSDMSLQTPINFIYLIARYAVSSYAMKFTVYSQTMYDLQIGNVIWPSDEYLVSQISSNNNTRSHHYNAFNLDLGSVDTNTLQKHVYIMTTASSIFSVSMSEHHEFFWSMPNEGVMDIIK